MTTDTLAPTRLVADDLERQVAHWRAAARTFLDAEEFASSEAWQSVEAQVGMQVRRQLGDTVRRLIEQGAVAAEAVRRARHDGGDLPRAVAAVQSFRRCYSQVEATLEFFGNAVNSRTNPRLRQALISLDRLAVQSMRPALDAAQRPTPPVLTYVDQGMGASILRAGIRLWAPGTVNPVAAIKIVRHNLYRPTSLFHETGHQVAHLTGWVPSMRASIARVLVGDPRLARAWGAWASEIAADVFAFLHTGFSSVSALYDVVGDSRTVLNWPLGDPHPVGYLRARLGCAFCRVSWGRGPWDRFEQAVVSAHPVAGADPAARGLIEGSAPFLERIARACLDAPVPGLRGRPMTAVLDPARVSPDALRALEERAGPSLWTSPAWRQNEGIRLVALAGLREAENPDTASVWIDKARTWLAGVAPAA